jgi:outer membrane receptor protein involved in Fe transport
MISKTVFLNSAATIAMVGYVLSAGPAISQTSGAEQASAGIETVTVTASRREQALIDVPQAVQALTAEQLSRNGVTDLKSSLALVPSASMPAEMSAGTEVFQIRGVSASQTIGDSTTGFYLDEFAFSIPGLPFAPSTNLYDLKRVEVLRGPSGTLYGQGSLGGTIKVLTNDPDLNLVEGSMRASASSTQDGSPSYSADAMVNIPIIEDTLAVRGVLSFERIGGYVDIPNMNLKDGNSVDSISGRLKVLYQATEKLRISLAFWGNNTKTGFTNRMDGINPYYANDTGFGQSPVNYKLFTGNIEYDLGFADLLSTTGYLNQGTNLIAIGSQPTFGTYNIATLGRAHAFSQEVRLTSKTDGLINYVAGAFYRHSDYASNQDFSVTIPGFLATTNNKTSSVGWAVYGEVSANLLGGRLIPTIGGRYFHEHRTLDGTSIFTVFTPPSTTVSGDTRDGNNAAFTPRFNLAYHVTDNGMFYAEIAKGFRSGAVQSNASVQALGLLGIAASTALGPDTLWNYEVGTKWKFLDNTLQVEAALYNFNWKKAQLQFSPAGINGIISAGDVQGRGADLTLVYLTPIEGLRLSAVANINSTELQDVQPAITALLPWLADGKQLPGTPRFTGSLNVDYIAPLGNSPYMLNLIGRYTYNSKQKDIVTGMDAANLNLLSFRAGISDDTKSLMFFVENATNERGPAAVDSGRYVTPFPRQIGVTFEQRF